MFQLIDALLGFVSQFFETQPDQHARTQVIALRTVQTTLTAFDARHLFLLAVKLLNFPPMTALLLSLIRV